MECCNLRGVALPMSTDATLRQKRLGLKGFCESVEEPQQSQPLRVALLGMTKAEAVKRGLEDGSYWVEQQQVVTFLLSTIARCAAASPLRGLPHEILQRIAQMAFRPRHQIRLELPDRMMMPPVVEETWLARGGQCLVFPCAPQHSDWSEEEEEEWGSEEIPYPTIRLPTADHTLYFELLLDDMWPGSDIHVHDVVFSVDHDEEFSINGTIVKPWNGRCVWGNMPCKALDDVGFVQRLSPSWQREFNYAVDRPFWRDLTTGETSWHPSATAPPAWRSFYPCECEKQCARLTLGLLVDLSAGFVTFRLNQVNGPRASLGAGWQDGVEVRFGGSWPEPEGAAAAWQVAIEQPLCVPKGLCSSPPLGLDPEWDPGAADVENYESPALGPNDAEWDP